MNEIRLCFIKVVVGYFAMDPIAQQKKREFSKAPYYASFDETSPDINFSPLLEDAMTHSRSKSLEWSLEWNGYSAWSETYVHSYAVAP